MQLKDLKKFIKKEDKRLREAYGNCKGVLCYRDFVAPRG